LLIDQKVANLQAQLAGLKGTPTATALQQQLAALDAFKAGPLPDMSVSADAVPPQGRTSPRTAVSLAVAIVAGLILGILGAFALEAFDTTFRREEQLRSLFSLPVLAKIPFERRARRGVVGPRPPESLSPGGREAYRTLRAMLLASNPARSILVTSASPREGKTTTAINLAMSLAASGARTILIEADMRLPSVGEALGVQSRYGLSDVLTGRVTLDRALVSDPRYSENLRFLLARGHRDHDMSGDALFLPTVFALLRDAEGMARHVIIDSPPLVAVIDAFELAVQADGVILVARLGKTNLGRLARLGELLSRAAVEPVGIALVGTQTPGGPGAHDYYQYGPPLAADTVSPRAIKAEPQP
jgi:non-specific protein-tyrosine kinase